MISMLLIEDDDNFRMEVLKAVEPIETLRAAAGTSAGHFARNSPIGAKCMSRLRISAG
jgi:hypothetical protein